MPDAIASPYRHCIRQVCKQGDVLLVRWEQCRKEGHPFCKRFMVIETCLLGLFASNNYCLVVIQSRVIALLYYGGC